MQHENLQPVCGSEYMKHSLAYFDMGTIEKWFAELKLVDEVLSRDIQDHLTDMCLNNNRITPELSQRFGQKIKETGTSIDYKIDNLEAYHGYTVYPYPDNGSIRQSSHNPDMYYGLAKATKYGVAHEHHESDAFNRVLEGEGIFTGRMEDRGKFPNFYDGEYLAPGKELELPIGMMHGHLVKKDNPLWFLFVQECGFRPELRCAGDFYVAQNYDLKRFGTEFQ